jgi:hypothetical protein
MFEASLGRQARLLASAIGLVIFLAAVIGSGWAARAEEDPNTYCQRVLIAGLAKAVAMAVTTPADFKSYFAFALIGYDWCRKYME